MSDDAAYTDPHALDEAVHHRGAAARRGKKSAQVGQLNLTSMIDVIFQLLIYFVITASFVIDEGVLTAKLPQGEGAPRELTELPPQKITVTLTAGADDITVVVQMQPGGQRFASFGELGGYLASQRNDPAAGQVGGLFEPNNPIVIQPGANVRWQHVVNAFNAAVAAKYTNVSFARVNTTAP